MNGNRNSPGRIFINTALCCLIMGLIFGVLSAAVYIFPEWMKSSLGLQKLRPLHVSSVLFWILLGAMGSVMHAMNELSPLKEIKLLTKVQWFLWLGTIVAVYWSYARGEFGGREYWEFPPHISWLIGIVWLLFIIQFVRQARTIRTWPVYVWMWMTGAFFFLLIFLESYLWLLPGFADNLARDMTIQWKANGSMVGAWNQLIYGTSFYLLDRMSGTKEVGRNRMAFIMYFLGLFNLMFNWGHHIYTVPTEAWIKYIGYGVSMTEWVFFIRILANWKRSMKGYRQYTQPFAYRFIIAAEMWVFISMGHAILMSIPALNLYTHGTHVTVAHAMGTTIGINTMILLAAAFTFSSSRQALQPGRATRWAFISAQISLVIFWLALNLAGIQKGIWQMTENHGSFSKMMDSLLPFFQAFFLSGIILALSLIVIVAYLLKEELVIKMDERSN